MDFKALLALMVQKRASDLFITAGKPPFMKVDGKVVEVSKNVLTPEQVFKIVTSIIEQRQKSEFEHTKECQFALSVPELGRFRVSAFTQRDSAAAPLSIDEGVSIATVTFPSSKDWLPRLYER